MAKDFENGISYYTVADLYMEIEFPEDKVMCQYCPLMVPDSIRGRTKCLATNEFIYNEYLRTKGCPLVMEAKDNERD